MLKFQRDTGEETQKSIKELKKLQKEMDGFAYINV